MDQNQKYIEKATARAIEDFTFFCEFLTIQGYNLSQPPGIKNRLIDLPMILAEHQIDFFNFLEDPNQPSEKIVLKARQIGITQVLLAYCLWKVLYGYNEKILFLISGEDKVTETISKIQQAIGTLRAEYPFLVPEGVSFPRGGRCENIQRKNTLTFQTITERVGRTGTYSLAILDEFAFVHSDIQEKVLAAIRPAAVANRIILSTPAKEGDTFHKLCMQAENDGGLWTRNIHDVKVDWFRTPENAELWLANSCFKGKSRAEINREYLCNFKGAATNTVWETEPYMFESDRGSGPVLVSLDLGYKPDLTAVLFARVLNNRLHFFDELALDAYTVDMVAARIKALRYPLIYGVCDSSGKRIDQTSGRSVHMELQRELGLKFHTHKLPDKLAMWRDTLGELYNGNVVIDEQGCPMLTEMLRNYEWKKPGEFMRHDALSHWHDAFVYAVLNYSIVGKAMQYEPVRIINRSQLGFF